MPALLLDQLHTSSVGSQTPLAHSDESEQGSFSHLRQLPPQSTPVSSPFLTPSEHEGAGAAQT